MTSRNRTATTTSNRNRLAAISDFLFAGIASVSPTLDGAAQAAQGIVLPRKE